MDNLKSSLKNYIIEFLSPLDILQFAKTSSLYLKLLKSKIDFDLIKFYKQFQIIKTDNLEKHLCIIIFSAQKLFNTTKFDRTTLFYLQYFSIKYEILFKKKNIFSKLLPYFESIDILDKTPKAPLNNSPAKRRELRIDNMSAEEICQNIKELIKVEGLTSLDIRFRTLDKATKEFWDLIKNQPFIVSLIRDDHNDICIFKRKIYFKFDCPDILKGFSTIQTSDILDTFDEVSTNISYLSYKIFRSEIYDFLNISKTNVLTLESDDGLNNMDISNSEIRVIYLDDISTEGFYKIINNNKGLIVYLNCGMENGEMYNLIRFRAENQINCLRSYGKIVIHSIIYKNQKYLLNININTIDKTNKFYY